ncbi:MAG: tetratricopeptide repeat protein [Nitrospiraceae bacterium]|nr:tetratricopeptide repeat protein [Nitrospiraceae bacterium]
MKQTALAAAVGLIVMIMAATVFAPALDNDFVNLDDDLYVVQNASITSIDAPFFSWAFSTYYAYNYHPLTWISHAVDYRLWGLNPRGHHATSILLHCINAFLVVLLVWRLLENAAPSAAAGSGRLYFLMTAGFTGAVFAIHPLRVESVVWVSERKDVLCVTFFLLSLLSYLNYAAGRGGRGSYAASVVFFLLAALSKPMAISLPVVLLLLDLYPLGRLTAAAGARRLRVVAVEKLPFIAIGAGLAFLTIAAQRTSGQVRPLSVLSLGDRTITALRELSFYIEKLFIPSRLAPFYPLTSPVSLTFPDLVRIACLAAFTILCFILWRRAKVFLIAWLFYVITAFPTLGIVQVGGQAGADRYTYLPLLGPSLLVSLLATAMFQRLQRAPRNLRPLAMAFLIVCALAGVGMADATRSQIGVWRDSIALWSREIAIFPYNVSVSYVNRARAYAKAGDHTSAVRDYTTSILMEPDDYRSVAARGVSYLAEGDRTAACADFEKALRLSPRYYLAVFYQERSCK